MKAIWSVTCVVALLTSPIGCNPFAPDQSVILGVTKLEAPATVAAASPLTVTLTVQTGGCTSFDRIDVQKMPGGVRIVPWGTDSRIGNKGVLCPANIEYEPHPLQIDPPFVNPFHIVVEQGRLAPVTAVVDVQ